MLDVAVAGDNNQDSQLEYADANEDKSAKQPSQAPSSAEPSISEKRAMQGLVLQSLRSNQSRRGRRRAAEAAATEETQVPVTHNTYGCA